MSVFRSLLSSVAVSGVVFSVLMVPLAAFGSRPMTLRLGDRWVFEGQLADLTTPYLGCAAVVSASLGAMNLAIANNQRLQRQLTLAETQIAALEQQLTEKDALIESLRFSEPRLEASGLRTFLETQLETTGTSSTRP